MKFVFFAKALSVCAILAISTVKADTTGGNAFINYTWMDAIINKTPVKNEACPSIDTDIYGSGFKVALENGFYGSLSASGSRWFPANSQWASVGVGPVVNSFGIFFSEINKLDELPAEKRKKLPDSYEELKNWKVSDSAYWESQGGLSFYLGTGVSPVSVGVFAVATGGWVNFLQKTGPNRVYVEISKKHIKSVSLGMGVSYPSISVEKAFSNSSGFAYEFTLDSQESIEAFERFMAGDTTKADELSGLNKSGVQKLSDISGSRIGFSRSFGIATPFIPLLSFKASNEHSTSHSEESSVWNEVSMRDTGSYIKQRNLFLVGQQIKEVRSFIGGKITKEAPSLEGRKNTEKLYGNFKFSYQSNWGQELRLRKYISKVKALTGLAEETCAKVPAFKDSLGFNQVILEVNWSNEYVREIIGLGNAKSSILPSIKSMALGFQKAADLDKSPANVCNVIGNENDNYDNNCAASNVALVETIFANLENYSRNMNKAFNTDKKEFSKNLAKFGEEVWKSPFVFKAFYEKGKVCGQEFKYEVSGQRLTRHALEHKYANTASCVGLN